MNKILSFFALALICFPVFGATSNSRSTGAAPRVGTAATKTQIAKAAAQTNANSGNTTKKDTRETEKNACIENNVGINNTFVWAAMGSDTTNYTSMIEDTENPENNACFVKVELTSTDPDIKLTDINPIYYELNQNIVCGSWVKESTLEKRILAAKKTARAWGTVAGSVGGAGVGVGSMELFGNRLIGGKVMGQKELEKTDKTAWIRSELLELKKDNQMQYDQFIVNLKVIQKECDALKAAGTQDKDLPKACTDLDYTSLLTSLK